MQLVVIGAGHAGGRAALAARAASPKAHITLVGDERWFPYERPPLSKAALGSGHDWPSLQAAMQRQLDEARIECRLGRRVEAIDLDAMRVREAGAASELTFDRLVLATGSRLRTLPAAQSLGDRLYYLRTADEAVRLADALRACRKIAIIGAGFIGLEVAAAARSLGVEVVVIDRADRVLARVFTPEASAVMDALHRRHGVGFRLDAAIESVGRTAGGVRIELGAGGESEAIDADLLVAGLGVIANDDLAAEAGLQTADGIVTDRFGATSHPAVFAAGEVVRHPAPGHAGLQRFESWQMAEQQAACAGASAAGVPTPYVAVPWFWSDQFDMNVQMLGQLSAAQVVQRRAPDGSRSLIYLDDERRVVGAVAFNAGRDISGARRLIASGRVMDPPALADAGVSWKSLTST